jgi:aryl-alcohol dehydrogenase-like predicted oxidoreductase
VLDYSKQYIVKACEESLKRLRRNAIDYYQLHSARMQHLEQGECMEAMELLKQQGKVRYWGLSLNTFYPDIEANYLMDTNAGDGFQLVFNLINQKAIGVIKKAAEKGYGVIARMPLQFGLLTGKFSYDTKFAKDDHRSFRLTTDIIQKVLNVLENKVWPLAEQEQLTKAQLALSFILSFQEISTIIPGIRTPEQVMQNTTGLRILKRERIEFLQSLSDTDWKTVLELMEKQG